MNICFYVIFIRLQVRNGYVITLFEAALYGMALSNKMTKYRIYGAWCNHLWKINTGELPKGKQEKWQYLRDTFSYKDPICLQLVARLKLEVEF
jgi:hypothetical protein